MVSGRLALDLADPFFTEAEERPLVITVDDAPAERLAATREVAEVILAGSGHVDLGRALVQLHALGARTVLVEGGPTLNGQLVAADLVDEVCLTLSPTLVGGGSLRLAVGEGPGGFTPLRLDRVLADGDHLFLRYVRAGGE